MRMISIIAGLLAATAAVAQDAPRRADAPPVITGTCAVLPMLPGTDIPVVEVMLGGKGPYRFAIDTGAGGHGRIKPELAAELGFEVIGQVRTPAPGGAVDTREVFGAPELAVGGVTFKDVGLVALSTVRGPNVPWDGILGIALFQRLALTLDYGNAKVRFGGPGLKEGLALEFDRSIPVFPLTIGGKTFAAHLDTGNGAGALFLSEADAQALPLSGEPVSRGKGRTSFGEFDIMEAPLSVPIMAGSAKLQMQAVGWPSPRPGGNLGSKGLKGMAVTIDTAAKLGDIRASGAAPTCPA
ncbi:MAG: retropepsin-like domain-containing protein [Sphingomonas sp.]|uniref:aspartyl protease family protein n=1 Tax=Sphingomonas sp. TaxID=28214 RepID=UPI0025F327C5|nr:aspartyl protease family protein [Sphingomonas sp.]MBX3565728.1 retropepsin-like domain-containing protein [Sphingomonas sp.]